MVQSELLSSMNDMYYAQEPLIQQHRWRLGKAAYKILVRDLALWDTAKESMMRDGGFWYEGIQYRRDERLPADDYKIGPFRMCNKSKLKFYKLNEG